MNDKRKKVLMLIGILLVLTIGVTYAYYMAQVQGTGNTNAESSAHTATIGEVEFNGENTFDTTNIGRDIYPGFIGVQTFTIGPYKDGSGIYEIDLEANVPAAFNNDIKLTIYKTRDVTNNNIDSEEGTLTVTNNRYVKQDTLITNGTLEKVYEGPLVSTSETILEQVEFDIENNEFATPGVTPDGFYTYYAVYEYLDNGNQNNQQGLDFDAKITVKYIEEVINPARDTLERLQALNNTLRISENIPFFCFNAPNSSNRGVCAYNRHYLIERTITEEKCGMVYNDNGDYVVAQYVGNGTWDSENGWCSYNENSVEAIAESKEEDCANIYKIIDSYSEEDEYYVDESVINSFSEVGKAEWMPQTTGLYELQDDYGISYYFRGNPTNNYVSFAGYKWRILRINGNGSIRLIYADDVTSNSFNVNYNPTARDNAYVGYMYGTPESTNYNETHTNTNNSLIKTFLDTWYENNILNTENEQYMVDAIFCNDRSISNNNLITKVNENYSVSFTNYGYGNNDTLYGFTGNMYDQRYKKENILTFNCPQKKDAFTVQDVIKGNGALNYPIATLTANEAVAAGLAYDYTSWPYDNDDTSNYLEPINLLGNSNYWYWTMTPYGEMDNYFKTYYIDSKYVVGRFSAAFSGIRALPVINIKSDAINAGTGTSSNPFRIE